MLFYTFFNHLESLPDRRVVVDTLHTRVLTSLCIDDNETSKQATSES
jgi:hypothetical protein